MEGLYKTPVYVSYADLEDPEISKLVERLGLDTVLTELFGFDKTQVVSDVEPFYYQVETFKHRQRLQPHAIVEGDRYLGFERLDKAWLNSGLASEEAKMSSKNDREYLQEIKRLGG